MEFSIKKRQAWMQVLARAGDELGRYADVISSCKYELIRAPETGMVMVRGKTGGTGQPFNLGEMTVTRCVVCLEGGQPGFSYLAGRSKRNALLAALMDAHLQGENHQEWFDNVIKPLEALQQTSRVRKNQATESSRVNFFTMSTEGNR